MINKLGADKANIAFYLPNPPNLVADIDPCQPDIPQIIHANGNHWRKIFTILAKLSCGDDDWCRYRDKRLLLESDLLCFSDRLIDSADWHIICGKASWLRLGFDTKDFNGLDEQGRIWQQGKILLVPYPDYRQFPNALILAIKPIMDGV